MRLSCQYWWAGSIGQDDANGWPLWFIEWGGRGYRKYGAPLFCFAFPVGKRRISFRTW